MVKLRNVGLTQTYRRNLNEAGQDLYRRVLRAGHRPTNTTPSHHLDKWLEKAIEEAYHSGERLYWVTLGVLGIQRKTKISGSLLRGTWKAIQGWRSLRPVRSRIPMTAFCLEGVVLACLLEGWREEGRLRKQMWSCGLALWLGFVCLLRPSEVLKLRVGDLSFPHAADPSSDPGVVVVVRSPKTRRVWHRQFVLSHDERLDRWLAWWVRGCSPSTLVFSLTRYMWNKYFQQVLRMLGLDTCGFTLGSLRAGGATNHFRKFRNLGQLQFLGRWSSASTLQFYLQEAFSTHISSHFSADSLQQLNIFHDHKSLLAGPPLSALKQLL